MCHKCTYKCCVLHLKYQIINLVLQHLILGSNHEPEIKFSALVLGLEQEGNVRT